MLRQLRQQKVMKRILWGLAIVIIPAFVLWGAGSIAERRNYAGVIFGRKISTPEYNNVWEAVRNEAIMTYGSMFYQIYDKLDLDSHAWDRLIMLHEAKTKKIAVSDSNVVSYISTLPFLQNKDGSFDRKTYEIVLKSTFRRSARDFEEDMRGYLIVKKLAQSTIEGVSITEAEIEEALKKEQDAEEKSAEQKKEKKKEESEEDQKKKKETVKNSLIMKKRFEAFQTWHDDLYRRAALIDNIKKMKEEEEKQQKAATEQTSPKEKEGALSEEIPQEETPSPNPAE